MEKNKKNEELQSRREFFKKAAKGALPILGAIVLSNVALVSKAEQSMSCNDGCTASCSRVCAGCTASCHAANCYHSCHSSCQTTCTGTCYRTCSGGCSGNSKYN